MFSLRRSGFDGIPSFSAAASEAPSSNATAASNSVGAPFPGSLSSRDFLAPLDQTKGLGREAAARNWPQSRQIVASPAGSAVGHWIEGIVDRPAPAHGTCSVSREQPEQ